jgi:zinc protease
MRPLPLFLALALFLSPLSAQAVEVQRVISPGGIEAWLIEDHANPILAVSLSWRGGAALDPELRPGLSHMTAALLDEGAGSYDSQAFQGRLEDLSIHLGFTSGRDSFRGSLRTLTENRDAAFEMLKLALTQPRFDAEPLERTRSQLLAQMAREAEEPNSLAAKAWAAQAFPGHPYGRPAEGTVEGIKAITKADMKDFAAKRLGRDNLILGVVGDITPGQLKPLLDQTFAALPAKAAKIAVADTRPAKAGQPVVVRKPIPQSVAVFGLPGIKRDDPDWYAAYLLNYVLGGGGFSSRLMVEVREKRGLAYSVYSYLQPYDHAGILIGGVATENGRVAESLALIRETIRHLHNEGVTQEELSAAKTYLTGSFALQFDGSDRLAGLLVSMQHDHLGADFLKRRNALIEAVTLKDVRRVAGRLLDPDGLIVAVVGDPKGM